MKPGVALLVQINLTSILHMTRLNYFHQHSNEYVPYNNVVGRMQAYWLAMS